MEAEYMALTHASKQGLWLRQFLIEIGLDYLLTSPITLHVDNKGAIDLTKDNCSNNRTKHIDIRHHFVRERVADRTFTLKHCVLKDMIANGLTKPLTTDLFSRYIDTLRLKQNQGGML